MHYIQPGKPDQNAYIERFNRSYRTEVLERASLRIDRRTPGAHRCVAARSTTSERPHDSLGRVPPLTFLPPRAHSPGTGPSERMVVSPGHEEDGILHMPTGQSAHPLSPYFGAMHRAWVNGDVVPFLPGPAEHTLTLTPQTPKA